MNYSMKNTKEELLGMLKEQEHLASAIDAKDAEIADLHVEINKMKNTKEELLGMLKEQEHLASAIDSKDAEIADLHVKINKIKAEKEKEIQNLRDKFNNYDTQISNEKVAKYEERVKELEVSNKNFVEFYQAKLRDMNAYRNSYINLLKAIQGTLDNSIELEAVLSEKLK